MWDAIVIGSGIGGLAAAAALARREQRVLVLEQHEVAGGLTQTFRRQDWTFATGVHYLGGVGPDPGPEGEFGRLLAWLTGGALQFAPCANPYDIVHLPGCEFGIAHPEGAFRAALEERFPHEAAAIDGWFAACEAARHGAFTLFALRAMPRWLAGGLRLWRGREVEHWLRRTLAEQLTHIGDPALRGILGARWGDYGEPPQRAPFAVHALVTGSYNAGAYYPVGGPARFAQTLVPVIEGEDGEVRLGCEVRRILTVDGHACGVEYETHGERRLAQAEHVISDIGVVNTLACLDEDLAAPWQAALREFAPGLSYVGLYIGFEGDIAQAGASSANHWIFRSADIGALWDAPADEDAPSMFVSFPSLKDPAHAGKPTAEIVAPVDARAFERWLAQPGAQRPQDYLAFKGWIEDRLLAQFLRHFPGLQGMVRFHELSTPLTQQRYVRSPDGAMYGLEVSAERMLSPALHVRSPIPGLLLAGQDVVSPGVQGACMGGLLAAAWAEPSLWTRLHH
ncbi:phytoene desaturase family protein [Ramlibacter sp. AN1133]|uniref:phytoene desaturase family protein n=1 Tax=Ramlibacter sp. AN1133 TaxID=3133429 RepID=UPI0030BFE80B